MEKKQILKNRRLVSSSPREAKGLVKPQDLLGRGGVLVLEGRTDRQTEGRERLMS